MNRYSMFRRDICKREKKQPRDKKNYWANRQGKFSLKMCISKDINCFHYILVFSFIYKCL